MWRQICHLEKFLHIRNVETICFVLIYAVLSQNQFVLPFILFCREINFDAIYAFLRGEKFRQKLCLWRKKDKYQVWNLTTRPPTQVICGAWQNNALVFRCLGGGERWPLQVQCNEGKCSAMLCSASGEGDHCLVPGQVQAVHVGYCSVLQSITMCSSALQRGR